MQRLITTTLTTTIAATSITMFAASAQAFTVRTDFTHLNNGDSVEGLGTVHELLNINTLGGGEAKAIFEGAAGKGAYGASSSQTSPNSNVRNGGIGALGGFADLGKRNHTFEFTFADDTTVSDFSLRMLDYGDYNKKKVVDHNIILTAFNANNEVVDAFKFSYNSSAQSNPLGFYKADANGVFGRGDALIAADGDAGNLLLSVGGAGITRVVLGYENYKQNGTEIDVAADPNIGFGAMTFTTESRHDAATPEPFSMIGSGLALGAGALLKKRKK
ncbi:MAG: PEP-CTERM sorting domain-containing protein [Spirulina sp. SIO3F2]|nr:PEP-CTERM sorting domain-containing protein [Spirulina sp. SIO3F2]